MDRSVSRPRKRPRVVLFAATLERGNGGLAQLARMTAKVLWRQMQEGRIEAEAVAWLDAVPVDDLGLPVIACGANRLRFVARVWRASLQGTHFVFDQLGLLRARLPLPGLRPPSLLFLAGVEIWEATPRRAAIARRAEALVAISGHTRDRAETLHGGFTRARVCWLGTENDEPAPRAEPALPRVLMVSRCDQPYKGHSLLVDCWPRVRAAVPRARLSFAGRGPRLGELRARVAASACRDSIEVLGFVPQQRLEELYNRSTVFAMPSRGEGFGLVYAEAMRHGLPVIATVHDAGGEVNVDGESGYNIHLERPEELPERLIELLSDPRKAVALGQRARDRWARDFRFSAFYARFSVLLEEFLDTGHLR